MMSHNLEAYLRNQNYKQEVINRQKEYYIKNKASILQYQRKYNDDLIHSRNMVSNKKAKKFKRMEEYIAIKKEELLKSLQKG
jgi:hypothetical protein